MSYILIRREYLLRNFGGNWRKLESKRSIRKYIGDLRCRKQFNWRYLLPRTSALGRTVCCSLLWKFSLQCRPLVRVAVRAWALIPFAVLENLHFLLVGFDVGYEHELITWLVFIMPRCPATTWKVPNFHFLIFLRYSTDADANNMLTHSSYERTHSHPTVSTYEKLSRHVLRLTNSPQPPCNQQVCHSTKRVALERPK